MKNLYIVRHGKTEANEQNEDNADNRLFGGQAESKLSPIGIGQAEAVGKAFKERGIVFDEVLSSPLNRAQDTAKIILAYTQPHQIPAITLVDALKERDLGIISGFTARQIYDLYPQLRKDLEQDPQLRHIRETFKKKLEGVESYAEVEDRLKNALTPVLKDRTPSNVLLVSHKHTIRCLVHWLLDGAAPTTQEDVIELEVPNAKPIVLERVIPVTQRFIVRSGLPDAWRNRPVPWGPDTDSYLPQHLEKAYMKLYADMGLIEQELYEQRFGEGN